MAWCIMNLLRLLLLAVSVFAMSTPSSNAKKVAVIGATGRLGRLAVGQLVDQGVPCNILVRRVPPATTAVPSSLSASSSKEEVAAYLSSLKGVSMVQGDVGNVDALTELLRGCTSCLALHGSTRRSKISDLWNGSVEDEDPSHAKQVNYRGVSNLIQAAKASGSCQRIVRITGKGENPTSVFSVLINMLGSMAKAWNYEGERLLRNQKDVEYTIIRPGVLREEGPGGDADFVLSDNGGDLKVSKVKYADIASLCIQSLDYPNAGRSTLTAMTVDKGQGASSWGPLLSKAGPDTRAFPDDMLEQHKAAVKKAVIGIGAVTTVLSAVLLQFITRALV